jgi:hypothetical protein
MIGQAARTALQEVGSYDADIAIGRKQMWALQLNGRAPKVDVPRS